MTPTDLLKKYWGYSAFRPLQAEIIAAVMEGNDALALLPTGGGKSICFQVPALAMKGVCIVVSPLIALMKDQVHHLTRRGIAAVAIYSGMPYAEIDRLLDNCIFGEIKFLYLSPERLTTDLARERIAQMNVNLIAVDEAHCISQWGYDFRPPYLDITSLRTLHPQVPILALTATATPQVVSDIQTKLAFRQGSKVFEKSFERQNLSYSVFKEPAKADKLLRILQNVAGCGIVYVRNRRRTKEIAEFLQRRNISADYYHAGLAGDIRSQKQDDWVNGKTRIMVATNAFGMGIDKPDVRVVVHLETPDSLEAYFQEAGRAGRDEQKAYAVLLYHDADLEQLHRNHDNAFPEWKEAKEIYRGLGSFLQLAVGGGKGSSYDFDVVAFAQAFQWEVVRVHSCLRLLEKEGWIALSEAVYMPATIFVVVSKEVLYDYQLRHRNLELLLKTILRQYQGAFHGHVPIREQQLAGFLKWSVAQLQKALIALHQDGMVEYRPQKDQPQLTFLRDRIDSANLTYDKARYDFLRQRHADSIRAVVQYATLDLCRSATLLRYFGQKNAPQCGVCDVCLQRNKVTLSEAEFNRIQSDILAKTKDYPIDFQQFTKNYQGREKHLGKVLQHLIDHGLLVLEGRWLRRKG